MKATRRNFLKGLGASALMPILPSLAWGNDDDNFQQSKQHRVLTCNIRVALDEDEQKGVGWSSRKEICLQVIKSKKPDIVCCQEVLKVQAADLREYFPQFILFGFDGPEMDANPVGYHGIAKNPVMFSGERYELLAGGTYWLSETPLVAGSKSWDTARARHANWVRLRERKTGVEFRVVNLHLDHVSGEAKINQAKMVVDESAQYQDEFPQVLSGDFNARFDSKVFSAVRSAGWKESYEVLHGEKEAGFTGHEFQGTRYAKGPQKGRIDYIWFTGAAKPVHSAIIKDAVDGKFPSDHFFMQSDFIIG